MLKSIRPEGPLSSLLFISLYITCMYVSNQRSPYFCFLLSLSRTYRTLSIRFIHVLVVYVVL